MTVMPVGPSVRDENSSGRMSGKAASAASVNGLVAAAEPPLPPLIWTSRPQLPPSAAAPIRCDASVDVLAAGGLRQLHQEHLAGGILADVAAEDLDGAARLHGIADRRQLGLVIVDGTGGQQRIAELQDAIGAVGDDVDSDEVGIGMTLQEIGDLLDAVGIGIEHHHLDARLGAMRQDIGVRHLGVDEHDLGRIFDPGGDVRHRLVRRAIGVPVGVGVGSVAARNIWGRNVSRGWRRRGLNVRQLVQRLFGRQHMGVVGSAIVMVVVRRRADRCRRGAVVHHARFERHDAAAAGLSGFWLRFLGARGGRPLAAEPAGTKVGHRLLPSGRALCRRIIH